MKRIISTILVMALSSGTLFSCGSGGGSPVGSSETGKEMQSKPLNTIADKKPDPEESVLGILEGIAGEAYSNMIKNYWSEQKKYFVDPYKDIAGRDTLSDLMWNYAVGLFAFESYYIATGEKSAKDYIIKQMDAWLKGYSREFMLSTGRNNNPAHDDAAWTAMAFMLGYRMTGEEKYLDLCHDMVKNSYDYWQDGDTSNGLWYSYPEDNHGRKQVKSIYCLGLMLSELEYYNITKGTDKEDRVLHQRTMDLYEWIEENMGRNGPKEWNGKTYNTVDHLYFCDFEDDGSGAYYPQGYDSPNNINPAGSVSSLLGNTGMAVFNKRLYDMTGEEKYLEKALNTANALVYSVYNVKGTIMNDRDAWTNCAFIGSFVREVLPLDGVSPELGRMFLKTAAAIMKYAYNEEGGYYGADWIGGNAWANSDVFGDFRYFSENSNTVHMLFATYQAAKSGLIEIEKNDAALFE